MCKKYRTEHHSWRGVSQQPQSHQYIASLITFLFQIHSWNKESSPAQPESNSSSQQQCHYICYEKCIQDLFREERVIPNLCLTNAECLLLRVFELPVLWWDLVRAAAPVPNPVRCHRSFNTKIWVLDVNVYSTQVILWRQFCIRTVRRRFWTAARRYSGRALIALSLCLPQETQVLICWGRTAKWQLQLKGLSPLWTGAPTSTRSELHPGFAQGFLAAGNHRCRVPSAVRRLSRHTRSSLGFRTWPRDAHPIVHNTPRRWRADGFSSSSSSSGLVLVKMSTCDVTAPSAARSALPVSCWDSPIPPTSPRSRRPRVSAASGRPDQREINKKTARDPHETSPKRATTKPKQAAEAPRQRNNKYRDKQNRGYVSQSGVCSWTRRTVPREG